MKAINCAKEPVKIRFKKLKNGSLSIYLDIYYNKCRKYEFLKLYINNGKSKHQKNVDKITLQTAQKIKYQRILEILNHRSNILKINNITLVDYCEKIKNEKYISSKNKSSISIYNATIAHLKNYSPKTLIININKEFLIGFVSFLRNKNLASNTIFFYFSTLKSVLNQAVRNGILKSNPINQLSKCEMPQKSKHIPNFLTSDNLNALKNANCPNAEVKRAFMFSCFSGLRFSDVKKLTSENIKTDGNQLRIMIKTQKTDDIVCSLLPRQAVNIIKNNLQNTIFKLPTLSTVEKHLKIWAKNAQINKKITFHTARHTFATMLLSQGADLYTISKLLGHSNITTTQIYAKVIDQKKDNTIMLLDNV